MGKLLGLIHKLYFDTVARTERMDVIVHSTVVNPLQSGDDRR
jgi:hypothetical protein